MKDTIGIIILTYNNINDTASCIESIRNADFEGFDRLIYLIDNSDEEKYSKSILSIVSVDRLIRCKNEGYAAGNNIGIKAAIEDGCKYVLVINNDTEVGMNFIRPLIDAVSDDMTALAAPLILRYSDNSVWSAGGRYRRLLCDFAMTQDCIPENCYSEFINGCCFMAKADIFEQIGFFNESYFMYNEDAEFSYRIIKAGMHNVVCKDSIIYHKVSASSGINSPLQLYFIYRNRLKMAYECYNGIGKLYAVAVNRLKIIVRMIKENGNGELILALRYALSDAKTVTGRYRY